MQNFALLAEAEFLSQKRKLKVAALSVPDLVDAVTASLRLPHANGHEILILAPSFVRLFAGRLTRDVDVERVVSAKPVLPEVAVALLPELLLLLELFPLLRLLFFPR